MANRRQDDLERPGEWVAHNGENHMKHRLAALVAALVTVATLGTAAPAGARADEMTTERAGREYLIAACRAIDASNEFDQKIWHGRNRIGLAEVRVRLPQLKRLAGVYGRALNKAARDLYNPDGGDWPTAVAADVKKVANVDANESYWRARQSHAANADAWLRFNGRANRAAEQIGMSSTRVRARLDLPPPGEGC